jgi:CRISPR system Cascade subunit CasE
VIALITRARLDGGGGQQASLAAILRETGGSGSHQLVWSLFPGARGRRDFLFRRTSAGGYIIVSGRPPEDPVGLWRLETKPYAPSISAGQALGFVLRASPSVALRDPGDQRGRRRDHARARAIRLGRPLEGAEAEETWVDWLEARAPRLGVSLVRAACIASRAPPLVVPRESAPPARMPVVDFEGEFEVREPERLRKACLEGVGGARAFGCGLLLLKPVYRR